MSAVSDTSSGYDTPDDDLDVEASSSVDFELTWQDLLHCTQYVNDKNWSTRSPPAELDVYPDNIIISEQLQRILSWSLQRSDNVATDVPAPETTPETTPVTTESHTEPRAEPELEPKIEPEPAQELLLTRSNTVVTTTTTALHDTSTLLVRAKSHRTLPLVTRLNKLRQDVAAKMALAGPSRSSATNISQASSSQSASGVVNAVGECISCFDELPKSDLVHLQCSHDYCRPCLREVVFTAMKNEAAFPPKCCLTEIALKTVLVCLDNKQRDEYREKSAEYAIPAGHRWYCPEPTCSKWIRPERLQRDRRQPQTCPHCSARICSMCRSLAHDVNQDCPQDFGLESTLEIAESEGWRRCYSCRTMVELTTGCRHITCRCGAEFCYVCNAVWRTCNCTEADKERRIRELRAQREQRAQMQEEERRRREEEDEAARLEAEEMAEALQQVEELERQDAIRRVEEERQRQLEEELVLARLEEARLLEEIARRDEEEEAERQFRQVLIRSSQEECRAMMSILAEIISHQHAALMSNHAAHEQSLVEDHETRKTQQASHAETMLSWLQENVNRRTMALTSKQKSDWERLLLQIENEEDEMFMDMHIHLRGKPNREQREKRMRDAFRKQQQERTESLQRQQHVERQRHDMGIGYEFEGLRKAASARVEPLEREYKTSLEEFGSQVGCDRQWLQLISIRRVNMLNEHKRIVLEQLEAEEEPIGLTEEQARLVEPTIPAADETATPSSTAIHIEEFVQSGQAETTDLYGTASDQAGPSQQILEPASLSRSNTVTRTVPGVSPSLIMTSPAEYRTSQTSDVIFSQNAQPQTNPEYTTSPSASPKPKHLSTDSHSSTSTSGASSTTSTASSETSTTPSLLDDIPATIIARHRDSASQASTETPSKGKGIAGLFRRGKKKELSEEEIRRRMSKTVFGDSAAGWGGFG